MPGTVLGTANIDVKDLGRQAVLPHFLPSCEGEEEAKVEYDRGEEHHQLSHVPPHSATLRGPGPRLGAQASVGSCSEAATTADVTLHPAGVGPKPWHEPLPAPEVQRWHYRSTVQKVNIYGDRSEEMLLLKQDSLHG